MDYSYLDKKALQPSEWQGLTKNELQIMTFRTCLLYGETHNRNVIATLFDMYECLATRTSANERLKMLTALSAFVRKNNPQAIMALFPFIKVEEEGDIIRTATQFFVNLSVLVNKEFHSGVNILLELIKDAPNDITSAYIILGLIDLDNQKVNQMLEKVKPYLGTQVVVALLNRGIELPHFN